MKRSIPLKTLAFVGVCALGQGLLQRGVGPQPLSSDYDQKINQNTGAISKVLKPGAPRPAFQGLYSRWTTNFAKGNVAAAGLSPDQLLFALAGFREMIAGILWVRADSFFDSGQYDAILPIIRLVTLLDPNQIDVYATGMWHIGYNFTDEQQRSDRRYIPSALALGTEGATKNPETYEMFFETGWMWYHKIDDDYSKSVGWFEKAALRPDMLPARKNLLAMAYQREGRADKALARYLELGDTATALVKKDPAFSNKQNRDTLESNADNTLMRMSQRGWFASKEGRPLTGYDVSPAFDVGFSVKASVIENRVIRFTGTWNVLPVGTRVRVVLKDAKYPNDSPGGMQWAQGGGVNLDPARDQTFMQEQLFVKNRRFQKDVDMSKDPTMYPFNSKDYVLEFYYNPRSAPPHIQDKFSWSGEGMTDKNFLNTEVRPGQRVVFARIPITRDQILRKKEWQDRVPVVKTSNYVENTKRATDDVILDLPSLRSEATAK